MWTYTSHLKWTDCYGSKQALVGEIFFIVRKFSLESHYVKSKCWNAWFSVVCTGVDLWSDLHFPNFALLLVNGWSRKWRSLALWNGQWKRQLQQGQVEKWKSGGDESEEVSSGVLPEVLSRDVESAPPLPESQQRQTSLQKDFVRH